MKKTPCLMLKQLNARAALASVSMGMDANERRYQTSARVGASCSYSAKCGMLTWLRVYNKKPASLPLFSTDALLYRNGCLIEVQ